MIQLKIGREDPTGRTTVLSVWPPRAPYGAGDGYGRAYFLTSNLLPNADFTQLDQNGQPAGCVRQKQSGTCGGTQPRRNR